MKIVISICTSVKEKVGGCGPQPDVCHVSSRGWTDLNMDTSIEKLILKSSLWLHIRFYQGCESNALPMSFGNLCHNGLS